MRLTRFSGQMKGLPFIQLQEEIMNQSYLFECQNGETRRKWLRNMQSDPVSITLLLGAVVLILFQAYLIIEALTAPL